MNETGERGREDRRRDERWYVIEAFPRKDAAVARLLGEMRLTPFRPMYVAYRSTRRARSRRPIWIPAGKRKDVLKPRFSPFVFVECRLGDALRWELERLCSCGGEPLVRGFLTLAGGNEPAEVPAALIEYYRSGKNAPKADYVELRIGERVELLDGPFAGFSGCVARSETSGIVCVEIEVFGRLTPVLGEASQFRRREWLATAS